ncbi:macrophage mannose receptor 1-like isoform X2 [Cygnus olor]|uniref:macrophage mannose receptor 1-like isoform X2 n=1 Tax=Cygnus olor TaxID=8869 RepID=UPI001ADE9D07|nr:macrophage mannose receptor 1-like isoform X2 [Cygnus olor]
MHYQWGHPWGELSSAAGTMYGNIEPSQPREGQKWVLGPGGKEACSDPCPMEENPYEPLDPPITVPSRKHLPDPPAHPCCSQERLVLVGAAALGISVLLNVLLLALGSRRIAALTVALDEAEMAKQPPNVGVWLCRVPPSPFPRCHCPRAPCTLPPITVPLSTASAPFLLYNEAHNKCVEARGRQLMAATCQPKAAAQRFQWLHGDRLRSAAGSRSCVTAARGQNLSTVWLQPCREDGRLQRWECRDGALLALAGHDLYFNYGNNQKHTVMLFIGDREWSRWVAHGSKDNICSRSSCPPCSRGWTYFEDSCYFHSATTSTWETAQRFCSTLGTRLLEVDSPEERTYIQTILQDSSWLGITDKEVEGTWKRADGTILPREQSSWHRNEPNGGQQENCAVVRTDGTWFDYPCTSQLPWVCEGQP